MQSSVALLSRTDCFEGDGLVVLKYDAYLCSIQYT
jgi:hypothetical protein